MCLLFVFWGRKNVSVGRAGIDPLTVWYINFSLWSHHLLFNVSRLRLVSMVVTDPECASDKFLILVFLRNVFKMKEVNETYFSAGPPPSHHICLRCTVLHHQ